METPKSEDEMQNDSSSVRREENWCNNLGQSLIKSAEISINGVTVQRYTNCQRCHKMFENNYDLELMSLMRQLKNLNGNMELCYDCDKLTSSPRNEKRGYNKLVGMPNRDDDIFFKSQDDQAYEDMEEID